MSSDACARLSLLTGWLLICCIGFLDIEQLQRLSWALQEVVRQRPDDPLEFLGQYLLKHNPKKQANAATAAAIAAAGAPK